MVSRAYSPRIAVSGQRSAVSGQLLPPLLPSRSFSLGCTRVAARRGGLVIKKVSSLTSLSLFSSSSKSGRRKDQIGKKKISGCVTSDNEYVKKSPFLLEYSILNQHGSPSTSSCPAVQGGAAHVQWVSRWWLRAREHASLLCVVLVLV